MKGVPKAQSNLSYPPSKKELLYNPDLTHCRAEAATLYSESGGNKREARRHSLQTIQESIDMTSQIASFLNGTTRNSRQNTLLKTW